ncbi:DUF309 domain-containing protein [Rossellomorea vietnamensis]|uniref:DUF309 domain-containing protein n=1 Tax=Rossellomorea vietnamensis TaxID=218284 RepID=A0A5D4NXA6_9BACI|nr:DUF309 domain-containing protein [Rossellomorea vietnamensis]TYS18995.1 DUF309 domain-containing protein [Rossellomorea vietnamensis]
MAYPNDYLDFLIHFHCDRDYFECHEVLEEYWKETDPGNRESVWVGLIQIAVGFYHYRRENRSGAVRILRKGTNILKQHPNSLKSLGIDFDKLLPLLEETLKNIVSGIDYQSIDLPLNEELTQLCEQECRKIGKLDVIPDSIIHRHALRDRSDVIKMRKEALVNRQKQKD